MDAASWAFVGSIATGIIGGGVTVTVAIINGRTTSANSFRAGVEAAQKAELDAKDERIALRDEQLARCQQEKADLQVRLDRAEARTT